MTTFNSVVAVYETQAEAEAGVRDLQQSGFALRKLSILGKEHEAGNHVIGYYDLRGHMRYWGARAAFWNDLWKVLTGAGYFRDPDIGGVLVGGPLTEWVIAALKNPVTNGLSTVGAGLHALSIPIVSILRYEAAVKMHKLLLIAHGSSREMLETKDVLHGSRPKEINVHFAEEGALIAA